MAARAMAILPLAIVVGILSYAWTEFSLNFTFHWVTANDNVLLGLGQPENFHLILPAAFVSWGLFFAAGGDNAAFGKIFLAITFGSVAALITMPLAFETADIPDFWGIALWVGIFAFLLVVILIAGDWYYVAGTFPAFASVFFWWIATGLDGWVPGDVSGNDAGKDAWLAALGEGDIAGLGSGAALGLINTPWPWVWFNIWITLICGLVLGIVSAKVAAVITPRPKSDGQRLTQAPVGVRPWRPPT